MIAGYHAASGLFDTAVADLRSALGGQPKRRSLTELVVVVLLHDVEEADRDAALRDLVGLLRPRVKTGGMYVRHRH